MRVRPQAAIEHAGWLRRRALVEGPGRRTRELWFDVEPRHAALLTSRADPFVLAVLFTALEARTPIEVEGEVSRALLLNLESFQAVWRLWAPDRYQPVTIAAGAEVGPEHPADDSGDAVMVFDGGLDACYTAWRHARRRAGRLSLALRAGLAVSGLPDPDPGEPRAAREAWGPLLADLGLELWTMRTNAPRLAPAWAHASGAVRAACLHWFGGRLTAGLLAATGTLAPPGAPCGSHPITDPWLGSDRMRILHDGVEQDRAEKREALTAWPGVLERLEGRTARRGLLARLAASVAGMRRSRQTAEVPVAAPADCQAPGPASQPPGHLHWGQRPLASGIHVFPERPEVVDGRVVLRGRIEGLGEEPRWLRFSLDARHAPHLSPLADPFACALLFPAMRSGTELAIHGPVSRFLLRNLEAFQQTWRAWAPREVAPVRILADQEVEGAPGAAGALMVFSGGLDSSFSVYRHHRGLVGRRSRRILAGLMVLGFDIPHAEVAGFQAAFEGARRMLASLGLDLWAMETNIRDIMDDWEPGHGTAIAACVHWFAGHAGTALVAATGSAARLGGAWGTHVLTDRLLSSDRLRVVTDGEDAGGRLDKAGLVAAWPEAMARLRVCFESSLRDRNCGTCPKCVLTALAFLAHGGDQPATLPRPDPEEVRRLPLRAAWEVRAIQQLLARARATGVADQPPFGALLECVRWNQERWALSGAPPASGRADGTG